MVLDSGLGVWVQDTGSGTLGQGHRVRVRGSGPGHWVRTPGQSHGFGSRMLDKGMPGLGRWVRTTGSGVRVKDTGLGTLGQGHWVRDTGSGTSGQGLGSRFRDSIGLSQLSQVEDSQSQPSKDESRGGS